MSNELIDINEIIENPENPRSISKEKFESLKKSIIEFPKMLELRPLIIDENNVVLGGNMRLKALKELGHLQVNVIRANELSAEQKKEFLVKDNLNFGEWDWDKMNESWNIPKLEDWGMDIPKGIDNLQDGEEIEIPQSVQLQPPKEYILIMAEPNSIEWEELKERLKLKMVRRGGYRKGSDFDDSGLERVIWWSDFKERIKEIPKENADSDTK